MKFLVSEHKSIVGAIADAGLDPNAFSFVKRRGKLHVTENGKVGSFAFFRKEETTLTDDGKWKPKIEYTIHAPVKSGPYDGWDDVMTQFRNWLSHR